MLDAYLVAIDNLTINPENRLKRRVSEFEKKQSEIDELKYQHAQEMKGINEQMDRFAKAYEKFEKANKLHWRLYEEDMKKYVPGWKPVTEEQKEFMKKNVPHLFR
jgi:hypothetical protein